MGVTSVACSRWGRGQSAQRQVGQEAECKAANWAEYGKGAENKAVDGEGDHSKRVSVNSWLVWIESYM